MKKYQTTLDTEMQLQSLAVQSSIYWVSTPHGKKPFHLTRLNLIKDEIFRPNISLKKITKSS